jgi:hypothetical protein
MSGAESFVSLFSRHERVGGRALVVVEVMRFGDGMVTVRCQRWRAGGREGVASVQAAGGRPGRLIPAAKVGSPGTVGVGRGRTGQGGVDGRDRLWFRMGRL